MRPLEPVDQRPIALIFTRWAIRLRPPVDALAENNPFRMRRRRSLVEKEKSAVRVEVKRLFQGLREGITFSSSDTHGITNQCPTGRSCISST